jgi:hypothetical protein
MPTKPIPRQNTDLMSLVAQMRSGRMFLNESGHPPVADIAPQRAKCSDGPRAAAVVRLKSPQSTRSKSPGIQVLSSQGCNATLSLRSSSDNPMSLCFSSGKQLRDIRFSQTSSLNFILARMANRAVNT